MSNAGDLGTVEYVPADYKSGVKPPEEGWQPFVPGNRLQGVDQHFWFHMQFHSPAAAEGKTLYFRLVTGRDGDWDARNPQGLVYVNGRTVQGLDINHEMMVLEPDTDIDMYVYFYVGMIDIPIDFFPTLVYVDDRIEKTYYDLTVPLEATKLLHPNTSDYVKTMKCLEQAANRLVMWPEYSEAFYNGLTAASDYMQTEFYDKLCGDSDAIVNCIGHTHIDVAWLWTLAQTVEKSQRSFATVVELMRRYPEYIFMSSQPQLYQYVKEEDPELYDEIKKLIAEGRWEVEGAMWLEADCNLISGESMVRQILHGKRFMKEEFNVDSKTLWLPDVFGYSAALPQILKKCGVDNFVTSKISWNEMNTLPYDTFMWEGLDGTEIFTNFITAQNAQPNHDMTNFTTYVGDITPSMVMGAWQRYQQKQYNDQAVVTFGYGDGGGGPTREMLERYRRLQYGLPGLPKARMSNSGTWLNETRENFLKNAQELKRIPRWVGELYLEFHRGTYTSMAKNKRNNRKCEFALQGAEGLCALDKVLFGGEACDKELYQAWEIVLRNQFHDIIPGSSIFEVYEDSDKEYARVMEIANEIREEKMDKLIAQLNTYGGTFVYNPLGINRIAQVPTPFGMREVGMSHMSWTVFHPSEEDLSGVEVDGLCAQNDFYYVELNEAGQISRLFDKVSRRDVLKAGCVGNEIQIFEDFPREYDNWEITNYYKQKMQVLDGPAKITPIQDGMRAGWQVEKTFLSSTIRQKIWLYTCSERIDFETEIDWNEEHMLVKAAFPLDIHTNKVTYETQFGNVERPNHGNTSWDQAKFEVCGHKWASMSEHGFGVSLMNDCKYGYNAEGSTLKLTLLKCGTYPNPQADKGHHEFTYAIMVHDGDYGCDADWGGTVREAYSLNVPVYTREIGRQHGERGESGFLFVKTGDNIVVDTVKPADDGNGIIMRMYDARDSRDTASIIPQFPFKKAYLCDLLENVIGELDCTEDGYINVPVKNFEIVTIRIV